MDALNVPNPANPNAQGQNAYAEPGPANQLQGPMVQNQVQGHADQNQVQLPISQVPAQGPIQVVQNVPVQPLQQPVPMQLAPAGIMPAPQIVLSKLDREETRIFR